MGKLSAKLVQGVLVLTVCAPVAYAEDTKKEVREAVKEKVKRTVKTAPQGDRRGSLHYGVGAAAIFPETGLDHAAPGTDGSAVSRDGQRLQPVFSVSYLNTPTLKYPSFHIGPMFVANFDLSGATSLVDVTRFGAGIHFAALPKPEERTQWRRGFGLGIVYLMDSSVMVKDGDQTKPVTEHSLAIVATFSFGKKNASKTNSANNQRTSSQSPPKGDRDGP